ncbi:MAG: aminoglycoside phosphotransferase family protein [Marinobacterium sp.]|nr:aminoglycoside phosphotransferase family protein [Marinobacterium sp.]
MPDTVIPLVNQYLATLSDTPAPDWQTLTCESSNHLLLGQWDEQRLVLRLNASAELAFGADRNREAALLAQLAGLPWMPAVLQNSPQGGWLLMRDHGQRPTVPLSSEVQQQLLAVVAQWQEITLDDSRLLLDYPALFDAFLPSLKALPMSQLLQQLVALAKECLLQLPAVGRTLVHHDLHPGNLCLDAEQLVVLDWEYGALGNPWFDVAALHQHCGLSVDELVDLPPFRLLSTIEFKHGLMQAGWLLQALETLWYWVRGLQGSSLTTRDLMQQTVQLLRQHGPVALTLAESTPGNNS